MATYLTSNNNPPSTPHMAPSPLLPIVRPSLMHRRFSLYTTPLLLPLPLIHVHVHARNFLPRHTRTRTYPAPRAEILHCHSSLPWSYVAISAGIFGIVCVISGSNSAPRRSGILSNVLGRRDVKIQGGCPDGVVEGVS